MVANVYDKIREMSLQTGASSVCISSVAMELNENPYVVLEYVRALEILGFVRLNATTNQAAISESFASMAAFS